MKKLKNFIITLFLVIILSISTTCLADTNETQEDVTATPYCNRFFRKYNYSGR